MRFLAVISLATSTCSLPATSFEAYRSKALDAAEETVSQAQTAILTVDLAERDRLIGSIPVVQLESAERAAVAATAGFAAVLPPDDRSERLRRSVLRDLQDAADLITRIRFALRRDDFPQARELRSSLERRVDDLERFVEPLV